MNERRAAFHALHRAGRPLLLPNAWDHASAAVLVAQRHPAIGTTSLGVAAAGGRPDGVGATRAETLALARLLSGLDVLLTVDVEAGFSDDPRAVAEFVAELAALGVVGINLEDGCPDGTLADPALTAAKIAAVREAAPELFVNARTDTWWLGVADPLARTLHRARIYRDAGTDGVFVPGVTDPATVRTLAAEIDAPLNVLYQPGGPGLDELGRLGVARVSTGSLLFRAALAAVAGTVTAIRAGVADPVAAGSGVGDDGGPATVPSYAEVQRLATLSDSDGSSRWGSG